MAKPPSEVIPRLAAGVLMQALRDLEAPQLLRALDALCWLMGEDVTIWADAAGMEIKPPALVAVILGGGANVTRKRKANLISNAAGKHARNDARPAGEIPAGTAARTSQGDRDGRGQGQATGQRVKNG